MTRYSPRVRGLRVMVVVAWGGVLALLRRAFSDFTDPERRQMGEKVKHLDTSDVPRGPAAATVSGDRPIDLERGRKVLPVLAHIIGVEYRDDSLQ